MFLTARNEEVDRIVGLELGAEDYVSKPFSPRELMLRIRVILRRHATTASDQIQRTVFHHDKARAQIQFRQQPLLLTRSEYLLLATLLAQPERLFSREQLLDLAKGSAEEAFDRSVDVHISRLRQKLEFDPRHPRILKTVRGVGYMVAVDEGPSGGAEGGDR